MSFVTRRLLLLLLVLAAAVAAAGAATGREAKAALPSGNAVMQWNTIAQNAVIASGAFQNEGLIYMGYAQAAVYDAVTAIQGGYEPYGPAISAPQGASADAAVATAAYETLLYYLPSQVASLSATYAESLATIPAGQAKLDGIAVGHIAAADIVALRTGDKRLPVGFVIAGAPVAKPGVWQRTPPAFAPPQTPWVGSVKPFVLQRPDQFLPKPPPALSSPEWATEFGEMKDWGGDAGSKRSQEQTDIARFWTTNVIRQYNQAFRDLAKSRGLSLLETARLTAMGNVVAADAQIACLNAKFHYWFWRPVTALNATDPGSTDGNRATAEQAGTWAPLIATPNHPEYPAAHGSLTSAMAEVFSYFLNTNAIDLTLTSTVLPSMPTRHFATAADLRAEIVQARMWAGLHFRGSSLAGVRLGRQVARYDLTHAFQPAG